MLSDGSQHPATNTTGIEVCGDYPMIPPTLLALVARGVFIDPKHLSLKALKTLSHTATEAEVTKFVQDTGRKDPKLRDWWAALWALIALIARADIPPPRALDQIRDLSSYALHFAAMAQDKPGWLSYDRSFRSRFMPGDAFNSLTYLRPASSASFLSEIVAGGGQSHTPSTSNHRGRKGVCFRWNQDTTKCSENPCKLGFSHRCKKCRSSSHPEYRCKGEHSNDQSRKRRSQSHRNGST